MRSLARSVKSLVAATALMSVCVCAGFEVAAQIDNDEDDAGRVARVRFVQGQVSIEHQGEVDAARRNVPLVEGDTVITHGLESRAEIELDNNKFVRLGGNGRLRLTTLRAEGIAVSLTGGNLIVRLADYERERDGYFEIDTPRLTVSLEQSGSYRFDVEAASFQRLTVREGGRARLLTDEDAVTLRAERTAERAYNGAEYGDWSLSAGVARDYFDQWSDFRDAEINRLRVEWNARREQGEDLDLWGADELSAYGEWIETREYGRVWQPYSSATNRYADWSPYRYGSWRYLEPHGWTWIGDEPWGWTPYHYGRWVRYNNRWCWSPQTDVPVAGNRRSRRRWWAGWQPALVSFVTVNFNQYDYVCWRPLYYGERNPHRRGRHPDGRGRGNHDGRGNAGNRPPQTNPPAGGTTPPRSFRLPTRDPALRRAYSGLTFDEFRRQRKVPRPLTAPQLARIETVVAQGTPNAVPTLAGLRPVRRPANNPLANDGATNANPNRPRVNVGETDEANPRRVRGGLGRRGRLNENPSVTSNEPPRNTEAAAPTSAVPPITTGVVPRRGGESLADELNRRRMGRERTGRRNRGDANPPMPANPNNAATNSTGNSLNNSSNTSSNTNPVTANPNTGATPVTDANDTGVFERPPRRVPFRNPRREGLESGDETGRTRNRRPPREGLERPEPRSSAPATSGIPANENPVVTAPSNDVPIAEPRPNRPSRINRDDADSRRSREDRREDRREQRREERRERQREQPPESPAQPRETREPQPEERPRSEPRPESPREELRPEPASPMTQPAPETPSPMQSAPQTQSAAQAEPQPGSPPSQPEPARPEPAQPQPAQSQPEPARSEPSPPSQPSSPPPSQPEPARVETPAPQPEPPRSEPAPVPEVRDRGSDPPRK